MKFKKELFEFIFLTLLSPALIIGIDLLFEKLTTKRSWKDVIQIERNTIFTVIALTIFIDIVYHMVKHKSKK